MYEYKLRLHYNTKSTCTSTNYGFIIYTQVRMTSTNYGFIITRRRQYRYMHDAACCGSDPKVGLASWVAAQEVGGIVAIDTCVPLRQKSFADAPTVAPQPPP